MTRDSHHVGPMYGGPPMPPHVGGTAASGSGVEGLYDDPRCSDTTELNEAGDSDLVNQLIDAALGDAPTGEEKVVE